MNRFVRLHYVGYGLLEAWVFISFFASNTPLAEGDDPLLFGVVPYLDAQFVLGALGVALGFLAMIALSKRIGRLSDHPVLGSFVALVSFAGAIGSSLSSDFYSLVFASATGLFNAWLWLMWGEVYSRLSTEQAERVSLLSAVALAVTVLAFGLLPNTIAGTLSSILLLVSYVLFLISIKSLQDQPEEIADIALKSIQNERSESLPLLQMTVGLGVPNALIFFFLKVEFASGGQSDLMSSAIIPLGLFLFLVAFFITLKEISSFDLQPLFILYSAYVVIAALALGTGISPAFTDVIIVAGWLSVIMLSWLYFAQLFRQGLAGYLQTFGTGQAILFFTSAIGYGLGIAYHQLYGGDVLSLARVCLAACAVLFLALAAIRIVRRNLQEKEELYKKPVLIDEKSRLREIAQNHSLTQRETEVFLLIMQGRSAPFIRNELYISESTVRTHIKHIHAKFGVANHQDLISVIQDL